MADERENYRTYETETHSDFQPSVRIVEKAYFRGGRRDKTERRRFSRLSQKSLPTECYAVVHMMRRRRRRWEDYDEVEDHWTKGFRRLDVRGRKAYTGRGTIGTGRTCFFVRTVFCRKDRENNWPSRRGAATSRQKGCVHVCAGRSAVRPGGKTTDISKGTKKKKITIIVSKQCGDNDRPRRNFYTRIVRRLPIFTTIFKRAATSSCSCSSRFLWKRF